MNKEVARYEKRLLEYRAQLILAEQKAQEQYDKTVLALSGGAFGISFAFVENFVGQNPQSTTWLLAAWVAWGISIASVLGSFYFSNRAMRKTIDQVDRSSIESEPLGGVYSSVTAVLNAVGGLLFLVGALMLVWFVAQNL